MDGCEQTKGDRRQEAASDRSACMLWTLGPAGTTASAAVLAEAELEGEWTDVGARTLPLPPLLLRPAAGARGKIMLTARGRWLRGCDADPREK